MSEIIERIVPFLGEKGTVLVQLLNVLYASLRVDKKMVGVESP